MRLFRARSFRPPDRQPDRLACNWMLLSAALAIGFHFSYLPLWLTIFSACILLWRYFIENHAWKIPPRWFRWLLLLIAALAVLGHYGTILGRDAGVAFMALLVALKILEIRTLRDYLLAVFLIYVMVLGALLFSQSLTTGAYAAVVFMVSTHALIRLNNPNPLNQGQSARVVVTLFIQAVPLLVIMYLLFPRIQGSLWGLPVDAHSGRTGMSEIVAPGSINQLYEDDTVAFRVEFKHEPPSTSSLYWRAFVLSDTDGLRWTRHRGDGDGPAFWRYDPKDNPVRYSLLLEPHNQNWIPTLEHPVGSVPFTRQASGYTLRAISPIREYRRYDLSSHLRFSTNQISADEFEHNIRWPALPSERVQDLIKEWQLSSTAPEDLVKLALHHFSSAPFRYTLSPPLLEDDTLDQFLFETRAGYCEHYASAFVALMRLGGVPARLVVGYQGGEWNSAGNYLIVRQSDAHAWAEVWLESQGWTRVDPTAAIAPERIELGANALRRLEEEGAMIGLLSISDAKLIIAPDLVHRFWRDISMQWDNLNNSWNRWVMAYGPKAQFDLLKSFGYRSPDWMTTVISMALAILLITLLIAALSMYQAQPRKDPAMKLFEKFCKKLKPLGIERGSSEGPVDFGRRVLESNAQLDEQVRRIVDMYVVVRYGKTGSAALPELRKLVKDFSLR